MRSHVPSPFLLLLAASLMASCAVAQQGTPDPAPAVQLAADTNRDGVVDFAADEAGEEVATPQAGALFLANCDSDSGARAVDSADEVVNGEADLRDLAVLRVQRLPLAPGEGVTITVDPAAQSRVRLFLRQSSGAYSVLPSGGNIPAELLREGDAELRIEGRTFADRDWDGTVLVTASANAASVTGSDAVRLRVAPFLLLSNAAAARTLYVREFPGRNDTFLAQLRQVVPAAGADLHVIPAGEPYTYNDIWLQDTMEIGYTEFPGHRMNVVLRANRGKTMDDFPFNSLLGPDYGWVKVGNFRRAFGEGEGGDSWLDWYGNLEVTPPLAGFPQGRVYYGRSGTGESLNPEIVAMLNAQGLQGPALAIDVGWLMIKHVDEMLCFVPSKDPKHPWRVLVPDSNVTLRLLDDLIAQGHGDTTLLEPYRKQPWTVRELRSRTDLAEHNRRIQAEHIDPQLRALEKEWGLRAEDFLRIPAYHDVDGGGILPNMVNAAVLNGHLLMSDPFGPVVNGRDAFKEYTLTALQDVALEKHFLDDRQYHKWNGNTHCATNVRRDGMPAPFWKAPNP